MAQTLTTSSKELELIARLEALEWVGESQVPLPPQSVIDFSARARLPDVTVRQLSEVVQCEPALTAELLRNVNSCVRGLPRKVDSIPQAIGLLGIANSTMILLTSALSNAVQRMESPLISNTDFRRESLERAYFAREIALSLNIDATQAYTAAMLQDILLPYLTRRHQAEYRAYLNNEEYDSIVTFERDQFGWTHAELAAKTLLRWGFSKSLVLAVMQHHESPEKLLVESEEISVTFPVSCSSLLMDVMRQNPDGITRLVDLHAINNRFRVMELAEKVDVALSENTARVHSPVSLVHRLQNAMLNQIDYRRRQLLVAGRQFGNYVLEEKLRESTMGAIFKARHIHLKRPAAIKVLRADRTNDLSINQFEAEVQLTSQLRHPNTVAIFDYGRTPDDLFFYAMELIDGLTLSDLVKQHGALPDGRVLNILQQLCGALAEAHGMNLIHRDIKPENIMISMRANRPDHVTLLDFGLVMTTTTDSSAPVDQSRGVVGTPLYMSPEAAHGKTSPGPASDLYSLAAVGYFLLTGEPVFFGRTIQEVLQHHMFSEPNPPSSMVGRAIAPELERIILQCLDKSPANRPSSAYDLMEQLSKVIPQNKWDLTEARTWWDDQIGSFALSATNTMKTEHGTHAGVSSHTDKTIHI